MILFLKDAVFFSSDIQSLLEEKASIDLLQVESRKVRRLIYSDISDTHTLTTGTVCNGYLWPAMIVQIQIKRAALDLKPACLTPTI